MAGYPSRMPATIRRAEARDRDALGRLGALLVRTHHDLDPRRFMQPTARTADGYGSWLVSQLEVDDVIVLVAEVEGTVVGYTYSGLEGNDWMALRGPAGVLHDIVVDPSHRGQGIGRQLLEATAATLDERGAPQLVLWTAEGNSAAQALFASVGFRRTMIEMTRDVRRP